ncbi:phage tail assembly protein [Sphingomonas sp. CJ99]
MQGDLDELADEGFKPHPFDVPYGLRHPVEQRKRIGTEETSDWIHEVTLRRPTGKDLKLIDQYRTQPMELTIQMVAALTGLPVKTVEAFDAEDLLPLGASAMQSADAGRKTGGGR